MFLKLLEKICVLKKKETMIEISNLSENVCI